MPWAYWPKHIAGARLLAGFLSLAVAIAVLPLHTEEVIASGAFYDAHHPTSRRTVVVARDSGGYELRFENFASDTGPDLFIYLGTTKEPHSDVAIKNAENANLGRSKTLTGGQSYVLPKGVSPEQFRSAAIWCRAYCVMLGTVPLEPH